MSWLFDDLTCLGTWVGLSIAYFILVALPHLVPLIGALASYVLQFVLIGGLMCAAARNAGGQAPRFADLFAGFERGGGALIRLSLIMLAGLVAVGLVMVAGLVAVLPAHGSAPVLTTFSASALIAVLSTGMDRALLGLVLSFLLLLLLLAPITMAAWLAPALIVLRGAAPMQALRLSLHACWNSLGALTSYGLLFIGLALLATLMFGLGWLFLMPLIFLSTYAALDDFFPADLAPRDLGWVQLS